MQNLCSHKHFSRHLHLSLLLSEVKRNRRSELWLLSVLNNCTTNISRQFSDSTSTERRSGSNSETVVVVISKHRQMDKKSLFHFVSKQSLPFENPPTHFVSSYSILWRLSQRKVERIFQFYAEARKFSSEYHSKTEKPLSTHVRTYVTTWFRLGVHKWFASCFLSGGVFVRGKQGKSFEVVN